MQEFHAFSVSPHKEHKLEIPEGFGFHLSVLSLPRGTNGKTTVYVSVDGKSYALASLDSQHNILQAPTDLIFNHLQQVTFFAKGSATVHCVGYRQDLDLNDDDASFAMGQESGEDTSDTEEAVTLPVDAIKDSKTDRRKGGAAVATKAFEYGEDADEEDEDEELTDSALDASDEEDNEAGMDEDTDEEELDSDVAEEPRGVTALHTDPTAPSSEDEEDDEEMEMDSDDLAAMDEDEDEDEEELEDDEDEDEEEEEEEEEEERPPMKAMRTEGRPNGSSSPNRLNGSSPQGRNSSGGSPQGRSSGGIPQQRRKSGSGSPNGRRSF